MKITAEGYEFNFAGAIDAFKFDEQDPASPLFHGAPMKAVDIIAEFSDCYLFVEVKQYPESYDAVEDWGDKECSEINCPKRTKHKTWLKNYFKYKYRDTLLYRFAENKVDKPIRYLCLLDNFDNALLSNMRDNLQREIPLINICMKKVRSGLRKRQKKDYRSITLKRMGGIRLRICGRERCSAKDRRAER